jgi:hypothetical protein
LIVKRLGLPAHVGRWWKRNDLDGGFQGDGPELFGVAVVVCDGGDFRAAIDGDGTEELLF